MTKCSIICTSHDRPKFLKEAIDSIFAQTMPEWQLIIVDSSTDPQVKIILEEAKRDKRVLVLTEPRNVGVDNLGNIAQAWNRALDHVEGKYISFLDDDNRKKPEFCGRLSGYLDSHPEYDAACCFSDFIDENGNPRTDVKRTPLGLNKQSILDLNYVDSGELMARAKIFDKIGYFDERLRTVEDWDMIIKLLYETKGIGILEEKLTWYRSHSGCRMRKTLEIHEQDRGRVLSKRHGGVFKIACLQPDAKRLTRSQRQVCLGITNAIPQLPFTGSCTIGTITHYDPEAIVSSDVLLVLAPFLALPEQMDRLASYKVPIVSIHMEDPQAIAANKTGAKFANWVVTNDMSTMATYKAIVGGKALFCPSLSVSLPVFCTNNKWPKSYDVVVCGHAYPSRLGFMNEFLRKMPGLNIFFVGDGWESLEGPVAHCPTQDEVTTMEIYHAAKLVVCLHRTHEDCGGFPDMAPQSIQRGYVEAFSGALVLIDSTRKQHSFGENEVVFYSSPDDLRGKIAYYLAHSSEAEAFAARAKARAARDFTFQSRLTKVINCVRSERYEAVIP